MTCKRVVIVEGPDGSGKSSLAVELARSLSAMVVHHGPYKALVGAELARVYVDSMLPALMGERNVVLDRSWLSEPIYGRVYRNDSDRIGPTTRRMLDRLALRCGAVVVRCNTPLDVCIGTWEKRKAGEYLDTAAQLAEVHHGYKSMTTDLPVKAYSYVDGLTWSVDALFMSTSAPHELSVRSAGNLNAKVVLVGEGFGAIKPVDHDYQWPFASFSEAGCSRWLTNLLDNDGISEADLLWVNADQPLDWLKATDKTVFALGGVASRVLDAADIDHTRFDHPQYHKRFQHSLRYPVLDAIEEALF
jgi:thymidylate kinase